MSDLIDRQAAIEKLKANLVYMQTFGVDRSITLIEEVPSAEVQPVRHGHWIHDGFDIPHGVDWMHCSECGKRDIYCPAAMANYCPNCGARMDGKQDG